MKIILQLSSNTHLTCSTVQWYRYFQEEDPGDQLAEEEWTVPGWGQTERSRKQVDDFISVVFMSYAK